MSLDEFLQPFLFVQPYQRMNKDMFLTRYNRNGNIQITDLSLLSDYSDIALVLKNICEVI